MGFTHKEWEERKRALALKRERERVSLYRGLEQAEVGAGQLTHHAAWNWFLQILAAQKEKAEQALAAIDAQARVSEDFSHEGLAKTQAARLTWQARIGTFEEVINLPKLIVDEAEQAKERLEALNRAETQQKSEDATAS